MYIKLGLLKHILRSANLLCFAVVCTCDNHHRSSAQKKLVDWAILAVPLLKRQVYTKPCAKLHNKIHTGDTTSNKGVVLQAQRQ